MIPNICIYYSFLFHTNCNTMSLSVYVTSNYFSYNVDLWRSADDTQYHNTVSSMLPSEVSAARVELALFKQFAASRDAPRLLDTQSEQFARFSHSAPQIRAGWRDFSDNASASDAEMLLADAQAWKRCERTFIGVLCELAEFTCEVYTAVSPAGAPTRTHRYIAVSNWLEDVAEACYPQLPALGVALRRTVAHEHATRACEFALATAFRRIGVSRQCARGWLYPRDDTVYVSLQ